MTPLDILDVAKLVKNLALIYPALKRHPLWPRERMREYQLAHLRQRLEDARRNVKLYERHPSAQEIRNLDDWRKLPIIRKADLLSHPLDARLSRFYRTDDLILSKSSGSTGQALDVYYDRESFYIFVLAGLRLYKMVFPYQPWHRQTYIYTSKYPFDSVFGFFPMNFISTLNPIPDTIRKLRANPPDLLVCYPSHLRAIADQMTEEDFRLIRPKAINVNSEMSSPSERKYLSDKFGCIVFDDYSSEELTRIASQCPELKYHIFEDINYLEILDDDGKPVPEGVVGNIVGSNLHNRAMPLLRYAQGDRGSIRTVDCKCGCRFRVLETLEGRKNDAFLLPDGGTLSSGFLLDLTYGVILNYESAVRGFCLLQESNPVWTLELQKGAQWNDALESAIRNEMNTHLKQYTVEVSVKLVEQVTRTASGKANPIISRMKKT